MLAQNILAALNNATIENPVKKHVVKEPLPELTGMCIRLMSDGAIYPSEELVKKFNLEYTSKDNIEGCGLDVWCSWNWSFLKDFTTKCIFISPITRYNDKGKATPKISLFGTCKYDDNDNPRTSVLTQGSKVFGEQYLQSWITEAYGTFVTDDCQYIDFELVSTGIKSEDGLYYIPKEKTNKDGEKKPTYERRENLDIYILVPRVAETHTVTTLPTSAKNLEEVVA